MFGGNNNSSDNGVRRAALVYNPQGTNSYGGGTGYYGY
jgi:hypothetical protein